MKSLSQVRVLAYAKPYSFVLIAVGGIFLPATIAQAQSSASPLSISNEFHYQGSLKQVDGRPLVGRVSIDFQILSLDGSCLLYEEKQENIDLTASKGLFNLKVGSMRGSLKRTDRDPGLDMTSVFANSATVLAAGRSAYCTAGYNPTDYDSRLLRISVEQGGVWRTITQDHVLSSVPTAIVAQTLQGLSVADLDTRYVTSDKIGNLISGKICRTDGSKVICDQDLSSLRGPAGPAGPAGAAGAPGAVGPLGPQGPKGDAGVAGAKGAQGDRGVAGPAGAAGPTGPQGLKGDKGDPGVAGAKGAQGDRGVAGPAGVAGPTGPQGVAGAMGPQGLKGDKGDPGVAGAQGPKGDVGPVGLVSGIAMYGSRDDITALYSNNIRRIILDANGFVGIGTNSPTAKLDIKGSVRIGGDSADCSVEKAGTIRYRGGKAELCDGTAWTSFSSSSGVTSISTGTGLSGGPITATGTISLANTSVSAGTYGTATEVASFTVDAQGRLSNAKNIKITGAAPGGAASGDLSGNYPSPTVAKIRNIAVSATAPATGNFFKYNGSQWLGSAIAISDVADLTNVLLQKVNKSDIKSCAANQTLSYFAPTANFQCVNISISDSSITFASQAANKVFASPDGVAGKPVFRSLAAADLPAFGAGIRGILPVVNGGTGSSNGSINGTGPLTFKAGGSNEDVKLVPSGTGIVKVSGEIQVSASGRGCGTDNEGAMRYNSSLKNMEFCNGTSWNEVGGAPQGTWCGWSMNSFNFWGAASLNGDYNASAVVALCKGHDPKNSCPAGYSKLTMCYEADLHHNCNNMNTCVKQ